MVMKVVKEDISKILARADITESTQWLSVKSNKTVVSTTLLAGRNFPKSFLGMFNYYS